MRSIWIGYVHERVSATHVATWLEVRECLPWWPEEPLQNWIVPGTYVEEECHVIQD